MSGEEVLSWILGALYAEVHYRFPFFPFSLYWKREPELLFDAPSRVGPSQTLPVALIIKDAHRFPIHLEQVTIEVWRLDEKSGEERLTYNFPVNALVTDSWWHYVFELNAEPLRGGWLAIMPILKARIKGRWRTIAVDNYRGRAPLPLKAYLSDQPFPRLPCYYSGELHCHTSYGDDFVEFGAPLPVIHRFAQAMEIDWVALTDHSYNLDDLPGDPSRQDLHLTKWNALKEEVDRFRGERPIFILGEEVTVRNSQGRNIHLIILGEQTFFPGSGDSAELWFRTRSELSLTEILDQVSDQAITVAAHPLTPTPPLEWLLLKRGEWTATDLSHPRLDLWQIANGEWDKGYLRGRDLWLKALAQGRNVHIAGGNDAHGNFNLFRQVKVPMLTLSRGYHHLFGKVLSYVCTKEPPDKEGIIQGLRQGEVVVSDGPLISISPISGEPSGAIKLAPDSSKSYAILISWSSHPLFGRTCAANLYLGLPPEEIKIDLREKVDPEVIMKGKGEIVATIPACRYVRLEWETEGWGGKRHRALTNPMWLKDHRLIN